MLLKPVADIHRGLRTRTSCVVRLYNRFYFSNELDQMMGNHPEHETWKEETVSCPGADPETVKVFWSYESPLNVQVCFVVKSNWCWCSFQVTQPEWVTSGDLYFLSIIIYHLTLLTTLVPFQRQQLLWTLSSTCSGVHLVFLFITVSKPG